MQLAVAVAEAEAEAEAEEEEEVVVVVVVVASTAAQLGGVLMVPAVEAAAGQEEAEAARPAAALAQAVRAVVSASQGLAVGEAAQVLRQEPAALGAGRVQAEGLAKLPGPRLAQAAGPWARSDEWSAPRSLAAGGRSGVRSPAAALVAAWVAYAG